MVDRTNDRQNLTDPPWMRPFNPSDLARAIHGTLDTRDYTPAPTCLRDPWQVLRYHHVRKLLEGGY